MGASGIPPAPRGQRGKYNARGSRGTFRAGHPSNRKMKRATGLLILGTILAGLLAGCAPEIRSRSGGGLQPNTDPVLQRQIAIYAAVIRQLVTKDHTFGEEGPGLEVVYVLDRPVDTAGYPDMGTAREREGEPFSEDLRARLRAALSDLPPIEFVSDRDEVVVEEDGFPTVKGGDGLVTLGPIPEQGRRLDVPASLYFTGLAGTWLTYVVEGSGGEWRVTGTTGPVAIS
jgi:hypothetical protein